MPKTMVKQKPCKIIQLVFKVKLNIRLHIEMR